MHSMSDSFNPLEFKARDQPRFDWAEDKLEERLASLIKAASPPHPTPQGTKTQAYSQWIDALKEQSQYARNFGLNMRRLTNKVYRLLHGPDKARHPELRDPWDRRRIDEARQVSSLPLCMPACASPCCGPRARTSAVSSGSV